MFSVFSLKPVHMNFDNRENICGFLDIKRNLTYFAKQVFVGDGVTIFLTEFDHRMSFILVSVCR